MKNHKKYEELIQGYLDNGLNDKERKDLKDHLKTCKICQGKLSERNNLLEALRSTKEEIECPDYLIGKILKNTTQKEPEPIVRLIRWKYLAVSAAAIFIIFTTVLFNIQDNKQILTTGESKGIYGKETPKETEILKSIDTFTDKKKEYTAKDEQLIITKPLSEETKTEVPKTKTAKVPLPDIKTDFDRAEQPEEALSGETTDAPAIPEIDISKEKEPLAPHFESEKMAFSASRIAREEEAFSEGYLEETPFVFPEEGSVVGEDFEIVLILENPAEKIEISLDGEEITHYIKSKDSNVIYIGSDSLPPLEEGIHYLSIKTPEEKGITFYKEG
jgi:hypothetical protein